MEQLELLSEKPVTTLRMPTEPIVRSAEIEDNYRWVLKRAWGAGPCVLWCGVNPSDANDKRDDPTMLREIGFSYRWGFGSLVKVNIYPFISANQQALRRWRASWAPDMRAGEFDHSAFQAWLHNIDVVRGLIEKCDMRIAAWGNGADCDDLALFLDELGYNYEEKARPIQWHCIGKNANGSPKHTLARGVHRVPDDAKPFFWNNL